MLKEQSGTITAEEEIQPYQPALMKQTNKEGKTDPITFLKLLSSREQVCYQFLALK